MGNNKTSTVRNKTQTRARDDRSEAYFPSTPAEWSAIGTVVSAAANAAKSASDIAARRGSQEPLEVSVLCSEPFGGQYRLLFSMKNCTSHGLYLERLDLFEPGAKVSSIRPLEYSIEDADERPLMGGGMAKPERVPPILPRLIQPATSATFVVKVRPDAKQWFSKSTLGMARAEITVLSSDASIHVEWPFRIRV